MTLEPVKTIGWSDAAQTQIDVLVKLGDSGELIPFTARADDIELHGRDIFTRAFNGEFGEVAAFVEKPVPVPQQVTMRQARLALLERNMLGLVDEIINSMPIETQRKQAAIEWEFSTSVDRNSALVYGLAGGLGLTDLGLDELFTHAATL